jgi:curli biogenesis system outer membrane secretion channel CsgG
MLIFLCAGCSSTGHHFTDSAVGLGYIKRIAVLPLENFTASKGIEQRSRELLITRILGLQLYEVVEKGELHSFLQNEIHAKEKALIDQRTAKRMAREFSVEAYMTGSIDEYSEVRNGSYTYPVIAITLRMVDISTGKVVWQASADDSGYSSGGRLFGLTAEGTNSVLFRLLDSLLSTMSES